MKKKFFSVAMAGLLASSAMLGLVGCGEQKGENELWITFYNGGYGNEWAKQLAAKFEEEHPGITVKTDEDTQLIDAVGNMMENGTDYDLIFCHDVAWEDFVYPGWIHSLDDLFETKVNAKGEPDSGSSTTFADYIWDADVLDSCTYQKDGQTHYYKVPWTIGTAGIAYNLTVMDRIDNEFLATNRGKTHLQQTGRAETFKWDRKAPQTYYELWQYCEDVTAAHLPYDITDSTSDETIYPFTWSAKEEQYQWDYVLFDWWGQLAGPETMNTFKNFGNTAAKGSTQIDWNNEGNPMKEVYDPSRAAVVRNSDGTVDRDASDYIGWKEFQQAYALWYNLVVDNGHGKDGSSQWSHPNIGAYGKFENEQAFVYGRAAMTPAACWIEYESREFLEASGNEISIMPTPTITNVKLDSNNKVVLPSDSGYTTDGALDAIHADAGVTDKTVEIDGVRYNRVSFTSSFGDSVMIPECATQKELAKEFILFMAREDNAQLFTRVSGGTILPYKYNYSASFSAAGQTASSWQASIFEICANSTKFNNYTKHPMMRNTNIKSTARMTSVWPRNNYYYQTAWQSPDSNSYKPGTLIDSIYTTVSNSWSSWRNQY